MFLDAGAGFGRHAFEAARRGARVVALDYAEEETTVTRATFAAMFGAGEIKSENLVAVLRGDATRLPFADNTFDCIVTSEVLEHIQNDVAALHELSRVLKPGGVLAATVPSWFPEKINWMWSDEYHAPFVQGGHVRIYSGTELKAKLRAAGLVVQSRLRGALQSGGRTVNDTILAPMELAARNGASWAQVSQMALENGLPQSVARALFARAINKPYTPIAPQSEME
jgi:SAM-dependent methyltransferase